MTKGTPQQFAAALQDKLNELRGVDVESATTIEGQEDVDVEEYAEQLGIEVVNFLRQQGFEGYASVEDGYLQIDIEGEDDNTFLQPLGEIDPIWGDLKSDAATLADEVIDQFYE